MGERTELRASRASYHNKLVYFQGEIKYGSPRLRRQPSVERRAVAPQRSIIAFSNSLQTQHCAAEYGFLASYATLRRSSRVNPRSDKERGTRKGGIVARCETLEGSIRWHQ